ncbi:disulfide bond formation protein DsbA [Candidatus Kaiserbacteria bacterium]|nr:disulfide bond formation protein DsbA [Candidatus Kaiserbacteria bacterium]
MYLLVPILRHKNSMETKSTSNYLLIPIAIVIAGVIIAGAVYAGIRTPTQGSAQRPQAVAQGSGDLEKMTAVSKSDHIRGNPDAPVKIVEYSDTECPFCKRFHETMRNVMDEYGPSGKVAWVYRHFPLDQLHPKADKEAEALECAGELGGNEAFWKYADRLFEVTPANNGLDAAELPNIAKFIGLDVQEFNTCLSSGKWAAHVEEDTQNAMATGGSGTPWSIIVAANGKKFELSGAQPEATVKQLIELALKEK